MTTNVADCINKLEGESEECRLKDKGQSQKCDTSSHVEQISSTPGTPPAYVPFALYNQLLERVSIVRELVIKYLKLLNIFHVCLIRINL